MIVIAFVFYVGMKWRIQIEEKASLEINVFPVILFAVIFSVVMGLLFRLPKLIIEIRSNKKWIFDLPKFLAISLPSLLILILFVVPYLGLIPPLNFFIISGPTLPTMVGVVFGYSILDCLKR